MAEPTLTDSDLVALVEREELLAHSASSSPRLRENASKVAAIIRELLDRRKDDDLDALAHSLAYESCVIALDCGLVDVSKQVGVDGWFDLDSADSDFDREVDYLEKRGLIQRDEKHRNWIAVLDESEADR